MNTTTTRQKFEAMIDSRSLEQSASDLLLLDDSTEVGMMIRVGIINSVEKRFPQIAEWIADFYPEDEEDPRWDVDYPEALALAVAAIGA